MTSTHESLLRLKAGKKVKQVESGKVREVFELVDYPDLLLVYVTDRLSAFDFVFGFLVHRYGMLRNAMTLHWKRRLRKKNIPTDLVAFGKVIDQYLPPELQRNADFWKRVTIVTKCKMIPYEFITRLNNVGSMARDLAAGKTEFCGHTVDPGTPYGAAFNPPLATPTTKDKSGGHDENVTWQKVEAEYPGALAFAGKCVEAIRDMLAEGGLANLIDIKLEIGIDPKTGQYILCDEISPDSSRYLTAADYKHLLKEEHDVRFLDKEYARQWAMKWGIRNYDPKNPEHCQVVAEHEADKEFLREFNARAHECFELNTGGLDLLDYHRHAMNL